MINAMPSQGISAQFDRSSFGVGKVWPGTCTTYIALERGGEANGRILLSTDGK